MFCQVPEDFCEDAANPSFSESGLDTANDSRTRRWVVVDSPNAEACWEQG
jgi:hypothetical protein